MGVGRDGGGAADGVEGRGAGVAPHAPPGDCAHGCQGVWVFAWVGVDGCVYVTWLTHTTTTIIPILANSTQKSPPSQFPHPTQPSNLLLGGCGSWKLGDLGHALKVDGSMPLMEEGDARYLDRCVLVWIGVMCMYVDVYRYVRMEREPHPPPKHPPTHTYTTQRTPRPRRHPRGAHRPGAPSGRRLLLGRFHLRSGRACAPRRVGPQVACPAGWGVAGGVYGVFFLLVWLVCECIYRAKKKKIYKRTNQTRLN